MIYYINLNKFSDFDKETIIEKMINMGYEKSYLSDYSFCPYLIIHKDFEDHKTPVYENINKGFLIKLKSEMNIQEITDKDNFITAAFNLYKHNQYINKLF